jgi:hypothetical protein
MRFPKKISQPSTACVHKNSSDFSSTTKTRRRHPRSQWAGVEEVFFFSLKHTQSTAARYHNIYSSPPQETKYQKIRSETVPECIYKRTWLAGRRASGHKHEPQICREVSNQLEPWQTVEDLEDEAITNGVGWRLDIITTPEDVRKHKKNPQGNTLIPLLANTKQSLQHTY